jgi:hypothetical protein
MGMMRCIRAVGRWTVRVDVSAGQKYDLVKLCLQEKIYSLVEPCSSTFTLGHTFLFWHSFRPGMSAVARIMHA